MASQNSFSWVLGSSSPTSPSSWFTGVHTIIHKQFSIIDIISMEISSPKTYYFSEVTYWCTFFHFYWYSEWILLSCWKSLAEGRRQSKKGEQSEIETNRINSKEAFPGINWLVPSSITFFRINGHLIAISESNRHASVTCVAGKSKQNHTEMKVAPSMGSVLK